VNEKCHSFSQVGDHSLPTRVWGRLHDSPEEIPLLPVFSCARLPRNPDPGTVCCGAWPGDVGEREGQGPDDEAI